jgi:hypothetical protein
MKRIHLAFISLGAVILAAGCGGGGGGSSGGGGNNIPTAAVQITATNATAVAKGANTSAQSMAKSGAGQATAVAVVAQPSGFSRSVLDISLAQFARVRGLQLTQSGGAVGVISGFPMTNPCSPSGTMTMDIQDKDNSGTINSGDVLVMSFSSCNNGTTTDNGSMTFTLTSLGGSLGQPGTMASPVADTFALAFNNFSSKDNATGATETINGDIAFSTSNDGTNITGTMSGTSISMTSSVDGGFSMTNYSISFTDAITQTATSPNTFSFNMTTASTVAGGSITIATTTPFTGVGSGNPTAGVMVITGANNSTLTLTANSNGTTVGLSVSDTTTSPPTVTTSTVTWAQI